MRPRSGLARTYQKTRLFPGLTVEDNIFLAIVGHDGGRLRVFRHKRDRLVRERARAAAEQVLLGDKTDSPVRDLSHGEQRQLEVGMARAVEPKLMLLDEPASGLSFGERERLTELLLGLPDDVTLILIEHDMDVALTVAGYVTMMHDGRKVVEGTPAEIRGNQMVHDIYLGTASTRRRQRGVSDVLLEIEGLDASYGSAQALEGVSFSMGTEAVAVIGRNGMGKTTLCNSIMGIEPPTRAGRSRFRGAELLGKPSYKIAGAGIAYVPQGRRLFQSLTTDEHLKMIRTRALGAMELGRGLRALSAARRAQEGQRDAALRRRAADARDRPRAADEPRAADHGRALRGARADDRGAGDRNLSSARRGGHGDPARRAEPRRGDGGRRATARDGLRPDRRRDDGGSAR